MSDIWCYDSLATRGIIDYHMGSKGIMGIAIIADSISCITKKQAEDYGISIIPVNILFNGQISRDVIDLSSAQTYEFLEEAERLKEKVAAEFNCVESFITDLSPVMGYATGRGTLALAYYKEGSFA